MVAFCTTINYAGTVSLKQNRLTLIGNEWRPLATQHHW